MQWRLPIKTSTTEPGMKALVTGSRGKSTIVRLLHAAFQQAGLQSHARITGVVPRELTPDAIRTIARSAGAHVEEMRWWLRNLPPTAGAIVLENSAISPDLQSLAGSWLKPDITVLTNTLPDHQETWGYTDHCAARVLINGIPRGNRVVVPAGLKTDPFVCDLLQARCCQPVFAEPATGINRPFHAINIGLALTAAQALGLPAEPALKSMRELPPDDYDFRVVNYAGSQMAMAFSANDINSTRNLFDSLQWPEQDTRVIYNHRRDRPGRLKSFVDWLKLPDWREVLIVGDRPLARIGRSRYVRIKNQQQLFKLLQPGERIFGCGNIAGLPISLMTGQSFLNS